MIYVAKVQSFSISPTISIKFPHLNNDPVVRNFKVIYHYLYPLLMRYEVHLCLSPLRFSHQSGKHDRAYPCLIYWFFQHEISLKNLLYFTLFPYLPTIYIETDLDMEHKKRQYRELSDETKNKISNSTRGRGKSFQHKQNISRGMTEYWKTVPNRPQPSSGETSTPINGGVK